MRIGYSFWGMLADQRMVDGKLFAAPDGNAFYSWSIINEMRRRGHEVWLMMPNRDAEFVNTQDQVWDAFRSWGQESRFMAYQFPNKVDWNKGNFPDLDVLFMEWRWPIEGRNRPQDVGEGFQPDLMYQNMLIDMYAVKPTKIIAWDLDCNLDLEIQHGGIDWRFTNGINDPDWGFTTRIQNPFDFGIIDDFPIEKPHNFMAYIGNRYRRDWAVDKYLAPISSVIKICMHGSWLKYDDGALEKWPSLHFHDGADSGMFHSIYRNAAIVPLLLPEDYCERGIMTMRILEAIYFGSLPVGLREFKGIELYLPEELIVNSATEMLVVARKAFENPVWRENKIRQLRKNLSFMDVSNFVNEIERVA